MTSADVDLFYVNMYIFCNLDVADMNRYEKWYADAWNRFSQKQKVSIDERLWCNHLKLHHDTTVEYILSCFLTNNTNIITSLRNKQFIFDTYLRFAYFTNINSDYFSRGLIHTFKFVICKISSHEMANIAFANLKRYILWISSNFSHSTNVEQFNSLVNYSRCIRRFSVDIYQPTHCLHGYLQYMFVLKDPVIDMYQTQFSDFLEFWFRQTGYSFDYHGKNCKECSTAMQGYKQLNLLCHIKQVHVKQEHVMHHKKLIAYGSFSDEDR